MFTIKSNFSPTDDQKQAINFLSDGITSHEKNQVLVGVTGSGKTFTMANVIQKTRRPALIISHNKTLAGQLYQEMREFFPNNAVSYFVSYYDFYQPEAYIPQTDTYIEKEAMINEQIDKLRLQATSNLLTRNDVIVVASVSCIYNIGSPREYGQFVLTLEVGKDYEQKVMIKRLVELQYDRSEFDFRRGTFRVRGDRIDIYPAYEDTGIRVTLSGNTITRISRMDVLTGKVLDPKKIISSFVLYPAKHYLMDPHAFENAESQIRDDLEIEYKELLERGKEFEANRLLKKVNYDLEMIKEVGYVNGIENYSRYFDGRKIGQAPYSLLDYFKEAYGKDWITFIDESHMTIPQIKGMYRGDRARKQTLIDYGFRLKSALDNRPLKFDEFYDRVYKLIHVSATPDEWELKKAHHRFVEQLVRPTGIIDPNIEIRPSDGEIDNLLLEIQKKVDKGQRTLVSALTKRIAEDLTTYLKEKAIRAEYLHSDIKTLERSDILYRLRNNDYDVLVGINLLREGLDLPEVGLVAILDAEHEGFLRSRTSLIQTMGRAARNVEGEILIYANKITKSISQAVEENHRRREYQIEYNNKHGIIPKTIHKEITKNILGGTGVIGDLLAVHEDTEIELLEKTTPEKLDSLTPYDKAKLLKKLDREMKRYAQNMNFEMAIQLRDAIVKIKNND